MKRPFVAAWLLFAAIPSLIHAQADTLRALRTPISPAFTLLGLTPISVERPSTPRAFAVSVLSATQRLSQLPDSWAVEVSPYWMRPHPLLTYDAYYRPTVEESLLQTLSVSLATSTRDTTTGATDLALGLRSQPVPGRESSQSIEIRQQLSAYQEKMTRANLRRRLAEAGNDAAAAQAFADTIALYADSARAAAVELQLHQERVGLFIEFAGGWALRFDNGAFNSGQTSSVGGWATIAYRWEDPRFEFIALGRAIHDRAINENVLDAGFRVLWQQPRFQLSAEGVQRSPNGGGRIAGNLEYRLTSTVFLYATYGRDHEEPVSGRHPLLALLGLSFEFGDQPRLLR
jgi:hypothetical protein